MCVLAESNGGGGDPYFVGYYHPSSMSPTSSNPANYTSTTTRSAYQNQNQNQNQNQYQYQHNHGMTTFERQTVDATVQPPTKGAPHDEVKAWVEHQLDQIGSTPLLGRFVLLGPSQRRCGGATL
jgi:hypothetical protein